MEKANLSKTAYDYLLKAVLTNVYSMGDPISEVEVSKELGISRSPVREAIRRLQTEGILRTVPGRGTFVAEMTIQDIREIFELRQLLEHQALKDAYPRLTKNNLTAMQSKITSLDVESIKPEEFYEADREFHELFINLSGNSRLIKFYRQLIVQIDVIRRISARNPRHFVVSKKYHLQILKALLDQDFDLASQTLEEHIKNVQQETEDALMLMPRH